LEDVLKTLSPQLHVSDQIAVYRALDKSSRALAEALREVGLERGDGIAILAPNVPEFFIAAWAAQRSGLYRPSAAT
jgi:long-chain acyl-CoA synthetase